MLANYGYKDASGDFFITIDTDKCDGCGTCAETCPNGLYEILNEDPNDPMREYPVVVIKNEKNKKIKYECNSCKYKENNNLPICISSCPHNAISHSW